MSKGRVHSIDALRGLMALSVMIYHYSSWSTGGTAVESLWKILGLYAVTIFYFVSGFSMFFVYWYSKKIEVYKYVNKRFFRLAPLFYFMSVIFLAYQYLGSQQLDFIKIILNFTFLFAIFDPSAYYSTGAWSIGNEMIFYTLFCFILVIKKRNIALIIFTCLAVASFLYFRLYVINPNETLSSQWSVYINPLNHFITFLLGGFTYIIFEKKNVLIEKGKYVFLLGSLILFIYPVNEDRVNLILGIDGIVLLLSSYCLFLFFISIHNYKIFESKVSTYLGDISYSIYLVHPLCWFFIEKIFQQFSLAMSGPLSWALAISFSIIVCSITYTVIEKTGVKLGSKFYNRTKNIKRTSSD